MSFKHLITSVVLALVPSIASAAPPTFAEQVYNGAFKAPFNGKVDGALVASQGGVDIGAFTGSRDGEDFVFIASDMVGINAAPTPCSETMLISWDQMRGGASHRELEAQGMLVGPGGVVEVTLEVIDLKIAGQRGFLLIPVTPGESHLPSTQVPAQQYAAQEQVAGGNPVQGCEDFWDNRDCASYGACAAGPEPRCNERAPEHATVSECIEAARCRRDKLNWAADVTFHSCTCEGFETGPIYWIRCRWGSIPVPNDCHVTWAAERAAVAILYATEAGACVPQIQIQRPPSGPGRPART